MTNKRLNIAINLLQKEIPALLGASLSAIPEQGQARFTMSKFRHIDLLVDSDGIDIITMLDINDGRGELPKHCLTVEMHPPEEKRKWIEPLKAFATA